MKHNSHLTQGLVILLALILLVVLILWLSNSEFLFGGLYRVQVKFESAGGLIEQAKVLMRGFRVGSVKGTRFEPDGIVVTLSINKAYRIPVGSTITIVNFNFIGERAIDIKPSQSKDYLAPGAMVTGENRDTLADAQGFISELRRRLSGTDFDRWGRLASRLDDFLQNVRPRISVDLPSQFKEDWKMVRDTFQDLRKAFQDGSQKIDGLSSDIQAFMKKLDGLLDVAERNQNRLEAVLQKLDSADSSAGKFIKDKEFWEMTRNIIVQLNEFLMDLKKNPKKYVKVTLF